MSLDALSEPLPAIAQRPRGRGLWVVLLLLVFAAGSAVGGAVGWRIGRDQSFNKFSKPQEMFDSLYVQMQHDLNLNDTQQQQVKEIMLRRRLAFEALRRDVHPRFLHEFKVLDAEVGSVLTPEQIPLWQAFLARLRERLPPTPEPESTGQAPLPVAGNS